MTTKTLKFSKVKRATYNPRRDLQPSDPEWQDIERSLEDFGQVLPLVMNSRTGNLVAGHQRMSVLKAKGKDSAIFAIVDVDEATERRMNIALNGITGRWDDNKLAALLNEMKAGGISIDNLGFSTVQIKDLLNGSKPAPKADPDATAPPLPPAPITNPGDLYELWTDGSETRHRVLCGNSEDGADWEKLMDGEKARMIFTDPPYGVSYVSQAGTGNGAIINDDLRGKNLSMFLLKAFENCAAHTIKEAAFYCFYASRTHVEFETALIEAGWRAKQQLIWAKQMVLGRSDYHWAHEPIFLATKANENCHWFGDRTETTLLEAQEPLEPSKMTKEALQAILSDIIAHSTVWNEKKDSANSLVHATQKPTSLARRALRNHSMPGEIVVDCFLGSASTLIAAELEGRTCYGCELDPAYIDVAIQRFANTFENVHITCNGKPFPIK